MKSKISIAITIFVHRVWVDHDSGGEPPDVVRGRKRVHSPGQPQQIAVVAFDNHV